MNKMTYEELIEWAEQKIRQREIEKSYIIEDYIPSMTVLKSEDAVRELVLEKCENACLTPMSELNLLRTEDLMNYKDKVNKRLELLRKSLDFIDYRIKKLEGNYYSYRKNVVKLVDKGKTGQITWQDIDEDSEFNYGLQTKDFKEILKECYSAIGLCNEVK